MSKQNHLPKSNGLILGGKKIHVASFQLAFSGNLIDYSACVNSGSPGPEAEVNDPITGDAAVNTEMPPNKHPHAFPSSLPRVELRMKDRTGLSCFCLSTACKGSGRWASVSYHSTTQRQCYKPGQSQNPDYLLRGDR